MPRTKKSVSSSKKKVTSRRYATKSVPAVETMSSISMPKLTLPKIAVPKLSPVTWVFVAAFLVLAGVLLFARSLIVVATVNNQPVWRWDFESRIQSRYGSQTVEEMVNEALLRQELNKRHIIVTSKEIDAKVVEIEKSLDGKISLKDALSQQNMTLADFRSQLNLQLGVEKVTATVAPPTDKEIEEYLTANKDMMMATDEASLRQTAYDALLREKKNQEFQKIFDGLKSSAKVMKFL